MKKLTAIILFVCVSAYVSKAQWGMGMGGSKVIQKSGDLIEITKNKNIKVEYDYSNIKVGAFNSEEEFVDKKVSEYNKKEKGKGEKWKKGWEGARKTAYQPKFEELFNKKMVKTGVRISENAPKAELKLIVKTTFIEPGFNVGIAKKPAFVNFEFSFVDMTDSTKSVAELYLNNVIGSQAMGFDFDNSSRIAESYAKAGKMLGDFIAKDSKK